ncbi:general transcription factor 3C polypeptide 6-like isoform X2 [Punica granatum]|uniref:General transcription factor 3C polypeptide 6-like isoform X2 n=1 Tax=Punica granatum TaxID=22663 RepID=A0A6P8CIZ5_PUNGR|nr:general transcription factor 3C polypeptide 6-like isoform X2 [Punica granatum]
MEPNSMHVDQPVEEEEEGQEEYVLLDLGSVSDIPPNAPYVLSGLDTLSPVLMIGDRLKLIGHYEETIGTCIIFSENDVSPEGHMEMGPSKPNKVHRKEVTPVASLTKTLKFRLSPDINIQDETMTL